MKAWWWAVLAWVFFLPGIASSSVYFAGPLLGVSGVLLGYAFATRVFLGSWSAVLR